jgi:putative hydrolase of the HAD superfamily
MFDDLEKNLLVPHDVGMTTVQVVASEDFAHDQVEAWELTRGVASHVHHVTDDLANFLKNRP